LGPPRLRMVVPDSRSMLCTEPYERPVVATKDLMLAPLSYALRNSVSIWSRDLFKSCIEHLPTFRFPTCDQYNRQLPRLGFVQSG
jgi:hypothetical protein